MKKINVDVSGNPYSVYSGKNIFGKLNNLIDENKFPENIFIVLDSNVASLHKQKISKFISSSRSKNKTIVLNVSEKSKSYKTLNKIYESLLVNNYSRDTLIIAIGGGIIGDIAGFAASTFARGVEYIHVPTTLLAAVDSSVGGKTGINFSGTKNIIGSFYQPKLVLVDASFFKTLPEEEIICGVGEIVKYGLLINDEFFDDLKNNLRKLLKLDFRYTDSISEKCIKFKAEIVKNDEREETGLRKILNLGHTFAHAIEVEQKHKIKHGQAVILGISCALHLSNKMNLLNNQLLEKYLSLIILFKDKIKINIYDPNALIDIMKRDKKNKSNKIKFVLLAKSGEILVDVNADNSDVRYSIDNGLKYFQ